MKVRLLHNVDVSITEDGRMYIEGGLPDPNDETHNCDIMGCSSFIHTLVIGNADVIGIGEFDSVDAHE